MRKKTRSWYNYAIQKGLPIIVGVEQDGQLVVWCPLCRRFHFHGYGEGLRSAHCDNESMYKGFDSYVILDIKNLTDEEGKYSLISYNYDKGYSGWDYDEKIRKKYHRDETLNDMHKE